MPEAPVPVDETVVTLGLMGIIVLGGMVGGLVSGYLSPKEEVHAKSWGDYFSDALVGVGAACLVPVFLQIVSSEILTELYSKGIKARWALVFFSYCVLGGISSRRFIQVVTDKTLDFGTKLATVQKKVEETEQKNKVLQQTTQALGDSIQHNLVPHAAPHQAALPAAVPPVPPAGLEAAVANRVLTHDDPWKGQFGGKSMAGFRRLDAEITPMLDGSGWCIVALSVVSTDSAHPLDTPVTFLLHPQTFSNYSPHVVPVNGMARLSIMTWGAFTVAALCDGGAVKLELDLSEHPAAQEPWKSR